MSIPFSFLIPVSDSVSPGLTGCHSGGGWFHSAALSLSFLCRIIFFSEPTVILMKWNKSSSSSLGSRSSFQREKAKTKDIWICLYPFPLKINFWWGLMQGRRPPAPHPSHRGGGGIHRLIIGLAEIQLHKSFFSSLWQLFLICVNLWSNFGNSHLSSN